MTERDNARDNAQQYCRLQTRRSDDASGQEAEHGVGRVNSTTDDLSAISGSIFIHDAYL